MLFNDNIKIKLVIVLADKVNISATAVFGKKTEIP